MRKEISTSSCSGAGPHAQHGPHRGRPVHRYCKVQRPGSITSTAAPRLARHLPPAGPRCRHRPGRPRPRPRHHSRAPARPRQWAAAPGAGRAPGPRRRQGQSLRVSLEELVCTQYRAVERLRRWEASCEDDAGGEKRRGGLCEASGGEGARHGLGPAGADAAPGGRNQRRRGQPRAEHAGAVHRRWGCLRGGSPGGQPAGCGEGGVHDVVEPITFSAPCTWHFVLRCGHACADPHASTSRHAGSSDSRVVTSPDGVRAPCHCCLSLVTTGGGGGGGEMQSHALSQPCKADLMPCLMPGSGNLGMPAACPHVRAMEGRSRILYAWRSLSADYSSPLWTACRK